MAKKRGGGKARETGKPIERVGEGGYAFDLKRHDFRLVIVRE